MVPTVSCVPWPVTRSVEDLPSDPLSSSSVTANWSPPCAVSEPVVTLTLPIVPPFTVSVSKSPSTRVAFVTFTVPPDVESVSTLAVLSDEPVRRSVWPSVTLTVSVFASPATPNCVVITSPLSPKVSVSVVPFPSSFFSEKITPVTSLRMLATLSSVRFELVTAESEANSTQRFDDFPSVMGSLAKW